MKKIQRFPSAPPIVRSQRWRGLPVLAGICLVLGGCASVAPIPLLPAARARAFEQRSLASADLHNYVASHPSGGAARAPITWDLASLPLAAFYFNPDLDRARARAATAEAAVQTASQHPNPSLQLPFGYTANPKAGESAYTFGLGLDIPVETAHKRGYRVAEARQLSLAARRDVGQVAWQVRSRLRSRLVDLSVAREHARVLRAQLQTREHIAQGLDRRLALGEAALPQVLQARANAGQARLAWARAGQQVLDAQAAVAGAIGLPAQALAQTAIHLDAFRTVPPAPSASQAQAQALVNRADVQAALARYEASEAALQLALADRYPDIHLGPGYTFDAGAHKYSLGVSAITLPLFNQNQGAIAEAEARRAQAAADFDAVQARAIGETERGAQALRAALENLHLSAALLRTQQLRRDAMQRALDAGEADALDAARADIDLQNALLSDDDATAEVQRSIGALEGALQGPLPIGLRPGEH